MKMLIGALVGGIILFFWQFFSWQLLGIHDSQMAYTPNQDKILAALDGQLENGTYFLPRTKTTASQDEQTEFNNASIGKPWARISYRKAMNNSMSLNLIRGFVIDFVAAFLLCWLLLQFADLSLVKSIMACLAVGMISFFTTAYLDNIWFESNSIPNLIDSVVQWGIVGAWLGFWLNRN